MMTNQITKNQDGWIKFTPKSGPSVYSQNITDNLLFAILEKLEEIRCGMIDVEDAISNKREKL